VVFLARTCRLVRAGCAVWFVERVVLLLSIGKQKLGDSGCKPRSFVAGFSMELKKYIGKGVFSFGSFSLDKQRK